MKRNKYSIIAILLLVFAAAGSALARDNTYVAACKGNAELRKSLATLHGEAQVDKHIAPICDCKYQWLLKEGISEIDIQKVMNKEYGVADSQMRQFVAAEIRAGFQCSQADKPKDQSRQRTAPPIETNETLEIKGISVGMSVQQALEQFPQIQNKDVQEINLNNADYVYGDSFIEISSADILSCDATGGSNESKCNKMSFAGKVPSKIIFLFIDNKLVFFNAFFNRADPYSRTRTRANSGDKTYDEIKAALAGKFHANPDDTVKSEISSNPYDPGETRENSFTSCVWINNARNEKIILGDKFTYEENKVKLYLQAVDYDEVQLQRKKVYEDALAKAKADEAQEKANAAAEEARKRQSDL